MLSEMEEALLEVKQSSLEDNMPSDLQQLKMIQYFLQQQYRENHSRMSREVSEGSDTLGCWVLMVVTNDVAEKKSVPQIHLLVDEVLLNDKFVLEEMKEEVSDQS